MVNSLCKQTDATSTGDDKELIAKSLNSISSADMQRFIELGDHLQSKLRAKDTLLADRDAAIEQLETNVQRLERELFEMHKRGSLEDQERGQQHIETVS